MNSSGIKRGMAALAVSAVAVAGIPALAGTANADSINTQVNIDEGLNDVQFYNFPSALSTKPDGTDSTVRLEAGGGSFIETVRFEYQLNGVGPYQLIQTVSRNDDGAFSYEWSPSDAPFNIPVGETDIDLRAQGYNGAVLQDTSTWNNVDYFGNTPAVNTINITADTNRGYYDATDGACANGEANVIVNGTASATDVAGLGDNPDISRIDGDNSYDNSSPADIVENVTAGGSTWAEILNVEPGYAFAGPPIFPLPQDPDEVVVNAFSDSAGTDTEDFESFTLYEQVITTVNAVNTGGNTLPDPANITVTVLDQNGKPMADVQVRRGSNDNIIGDVVTGKNSTDAKGQIRTTQTPTQANPTDFYYADQTCTPGLSPAAGDKRSATVVADLAGSITISSNPAGTIPVGGSVTETATVRNNAGQPVANTVVRIQRNGPGATQDVQFLTTNAAGQVTYTFTCNVAGSVNVRAAFDDPSSGPVVVPPGDVIYDRFVDDKVTCGVVAPVKKKINPAIKGKNVNGGNDWVLVRAKAANGAKVKIFKIVGKNRRVLIDTGRLNGNGVFKHVYKDSNGTDLTTYKAVVAATADTQRGVTNRLQQPKIK